MFVSKIVVLVAHEGRFDSERLEDVIEAAVGPDLDGTIFDVREDGTHEVTLGSNRLLTRRGRTVTTRNSS
jgi:hypothetical protein